MTRVVGVALLVGLLAACSGASDSATPSTSGTPRLTAPSTTAPSTTAPVARTSAESRYGQVSAGGGVVVFERRKLGAPMNAWYATSARVDTASGCWVLIGLDGQSYLPVLAFPVDRAANGLQAGVYGGLETTRDAISLPSDVCAGVARVLYRVSFEGLYAPAPSQPTAVPASHVIVPGTVVVDNRTTLRPELTELRRDARARGISTLQAVQERFSREAGASQTPHMSRQTIDGIDASGFADIETLARSQGLSYDEALDRWLFQQQAADVASAISREYPSDFSSFEFLADGTLCIRLSGAVPSGLVRRFDQVPHRVEIVPHNGISGAVLVPVAHSFSRQLSQDWSQVELHYEATTTRLIASVSGPRSADVRLPSPRTVATADGPLELVAVVAPSAQPFD